MVQGVISFGWLSLYMLQTAFQEQYTPGPCDCLSIHRRAKRMYQNANIMSLCGINRVLGHVKLSFAAWCTNAMIALSETTPKEKRQ